MTVEEIRDVLQGWLTERTGEAVDPDVQFSLHERVDSFDVLELIVFSERHFGVSFSADDFASPAFATLSGLARIIRSRV